MPQATPLRERHCRLPLPGSDTTGSVPGSRQTPKAVDVEDRLPAKACGASRQIVPDAAGDQPVRIPARELRHTGTGPDGALLVTPSSAMVGTVITEMR